ncbi:unnamed protein product, partial [Amoebophrya sp. A120]
SAKLRPPLPKSGTIKTKSELILEKQLLQEQKEKAAEEELKLQTLQKIRLPGPENKPADFVVVPKAAAGSAADNIPPIMAAPAPPRDSSEEDPIFESPEPCSTYSGQIVIEQNEHAPELQVQKKAQKKNGG